MTVCCVPPASSRLAQSWRKTMEGRDGVERTNAFHADASRACKSFGCLEQEAVHFGIAGMSSRDEVKLCSGPCSGELPGHIGRPGEVQSTVQKHSRNARQSIRVTQQLVLLQPGCVREIMRHESRKGHPEAFVRVTRIGRDVAVLQ